MPRTATIASNYVRDLVSSLSESEIFQILKDYNTFESQGFIGECELRRHSESLRDRFLSSGSPTMWMDRLAHECYRHLALALLKEKHGPLSYTKLELE